MPKVSTMFKDAVLTAKKNYADLLSGAWEPDGETLDQIAAHGEIEIKAFRKQLDRELAVAYDNGFKAGMKAYKAYKEKEGEAHA